MDRLKILHLSNYAGGGGADLAFRLTVDALKEFGDCVNWTACISDLQDADVDLTSWQSSQGLGKLRYIYSPENRASLENFLVEHQPHILHAHGFYSEISPSILVAIRKARQQWGMKFVQTAHSHELICANASAYDYSAGRICTDCKGRQPKLKIFYRNCDQRGWVYSWTKGIRCFVAQVLLGQVALTDKIICPSSLMQRNLLDEGVPASKLDVVRTPVNAPLQVIGSERSKEVVYFGRFSREKNIVALFESFIEFRTKFPEWKLVLIGDGEETRTLQNLIAETESEGSVELHPFMDQAALYQRIGQSQIMVMASSVLENWPLVIPEAVMCGLYPIVPDHGGMKEVAQWLGTGSCYRTADRTSLVEALVLAVDGLESNRSTVGQAQVKIQDELNAKTYVDLVMQIYRGLTSVP